MSRWWNAGDAVAALLMLGFSVPKLMGAARSVEGFRAIGAFLGVDPLGPRLFTGVVELTVVAALLASLAARGALRQRLAQVAHLLLVATMSGAVFTELVVRPGEANVLLALALVIGAFSTLRLMQLRAGPSSDATSGDGQTTAHTSSGRAGASVGSA